MNNTDVLLMTLPGLNSEIPECGQEPFLVISGHDLRSHRKANMHFIAEELSRRGVTRFFSFGFSLLSYLKLDPRLSLWWRSNKVETVGGVDCYLWRTPLHPVNLRSKKLKRLEAAMFKCYRNVVPNIFREWIAESNTIIFESGFPIIFIRLCKKINPKARLLYIASDSLETIGCANFITVEFSELAPTLDGIRIPSHRLKDEMPPKCRTSFVPYGIVKSIADHTEPSPYSGGINAVSVGSMLFDPSFHAYPVDAYIH